MHATCSDGENPTKARRRKCSASSSLPPSPGDALARGDGNHTIPTSATAGASGAAGALLTQSAAAPKRRPPGEIAVCINNPHGLKAEGLERLLWDPRDRDGAELPFISQPLPALLQSLEVVLSWLFLTN